MKKKEENEGENEKGKHIILRYRVKSWVFGAEFRGT